MKQALKDAWLEALRSGRYTQGQGRLRTRRNTFCCLGVLADIDSDMAWRQAERGWWAQCKGKWGWKYLPISRKVSKHNQDLLACQNDDGKTFEEIATWIEEHIPGK